MSESEPESFTDVDSALLDVDLFLKYDALDRAIVRLRAALDRNPRSLKLRERLRSITSTPYPDEAARQCLALASIYIEHEDFQTAHDRLLEAKQLNPRINIAPGLNAIRRARRPELQQQADVAAQNNTSVPNATLFGDLSAIGVFDAIQVIENSRLTGYLKFDLSEKDGRVLFNEGRIVGAETDTLNGEEAFRGLVEITTGTFIFHKAGQLFPVTINAASNTNLILDSLRQVDEDKM